MKNRVRRLRAILAALAVMSVVLGIGMGTASASAGRPASSPAATHHGIKYIIVGKWVHHNQPKVSSRAPACAADVIDWADSSRYVFIWDGKTYYHDGPGGDPTVTVTRASLIGATLTAGAEFSINELIADSKVSVSASITRSVTTTTGQAYHHVIPAHKYGNLQYGAWGYEVHIEQAYRHSNCVITHKSLGYGYAPTKAVGWYYWTTST